MVGIIFGLAICMTFAGGTFFGYWIAGKKPEEKHEEEMPIDIARQWANIMTYDGTERGQIGENDYDT